MEVASLSLCERQKKVCGDCYRYEDLTRSKLLVLCLSDGVSSCSCDWKASKTVCDAFMAHFLKENNTDISGRMRESVVSAHLLLMDSRARGDALTATLIAAVWDYGKDCIYYTAIGDSRIYTVSAAGMKQISADDSKPVIMRQRDGKPYNEGGSVSIRQGLTNAMGSGALTFDVKTIPAKEIFSLVCATDGFYSCEIFKDNDIVDLTDQFYLQKALEKWQNLLRDAQSDDATVLIARKSEVPAELYGKIRSIVEQSKHFDEAGPVSRYFIGRVLLEQFSEFIRDKDERNIILWLDYIERHLFDFGRDRINDLINLAMQSGYTEQTVIKRLIEQVRRSRL